MLETLIAYAATVEVSTLVYSVGGTALAGVGSNIANYYLTKSATEAQFRDEISRLQAQIAAKEGKAERDVELDEIEKKQGKSIAIAQEESQSYLSQAYETASNTITSLKSMLFSTRQALNETKEELTEAQEVCKEQSKTITKLTSQTKELARVVVSQDEKIKALVTEAPKEAALPESTTTYLSSFFGR